MMPFLKRKQESAANFASSFAPGSNLGITLRNWVTWMMGVPFVANYFIGRDLKDNFELPEKQLLNH